MILPIGHQERSVRRLPWVTLTLMALCLVVFLFTDTEQTTGPDPQERLEEAAHYWRTHAYLEADPAIREHVSYDVMPNQRSQYLETLPELAEPLRPDTEEGVAEQQAELDRLTGLALGSVQKPAHEQTAFERWGVIPKAPRAVTFVTYMFVHVGWMHLIGNLLMLLLAGPPIEDRWGRAVFAAVYGLAGIFAGVFYVLLSGDSALPMVGASGAVAGVLGAFCVRLWKTQIRFAYFFLFGLRPLAGTFEAPAWAMLSLWFANELFQALVWDSVGLAGGTAYWAHVGGFGFGVGAAFAARAVRLEERWVNPVVEAALTRFEANPVLEEAMAAREAGDLGRALELLRAEWQRRPDDEIGLALWDAARACAEPELGIPGLASAVRGAARRGELEVALRHWSELSDHAPGELLDAACLLRFVPALIAEGQQERAQLALRQIVHPDNALTPGQALQALELGRQLDPPSALRAARRALQSPDLHEAKRARLETAVAELEAAGAAEIEATPERSELAPAPDTRVQADGTVDLSRFARAKLVEGRPTELGPDAMKIALDDERQAHVPLAKIQAVAAALVADLGPKPVLLIDLLANWNDAEGEELKGVRLRSDRFDPRRLLGVEGDARRAFSALVGRLVQASHALPLPGPQAALGNPWPRFDTLAEYERLVLEVGE